MRLAFSTLACPDWSLERAAEAAVEYGYKGIELRLLDGELVSAAMTERQRERTRGVLAGSGLALCCVDTSFEIADPSAPLDEASEYVELAASLGGPLIRLFAGAPRGEPWDETAKRTARRLALLAERGRALGVGIGVETHDSFAAGEVLAGVLSLVDDPQVGVIWDMLNTVLTGEPAERTLAAVGDRVVHVHVKDGAAGADPEENRLLGEGAVPVREILSMLVARGYDGWLSVEWEKKWQPEIAEPEVALPQYARVLRRYLADLV